MKERPILFNTEMVKTVLDGRKTQTRRVIKCVPSNFCFGDVAAVTNGDRWAISRSKYNHLSGCWPPKGEPGLKCPYGQVGDVLYVRETIRTICYGRGEKFAYGEHCVEYMADKKLVKCPEERDEWWRHNWHVRPSTAISSIHMPKDLARIHLEITAIRVERLLDITEIDAMHEGDPRQGLIANENTHTDWFKHLWNGLYWDTGYSWEDNPWVWVVEFKRIEK